MAGDIPSVGELLAEDFCYVDIYGQILDQTRYFALLSHIPAGAITMQLGDVTTRGYGPLVHVIGDYTVDGRLDTGKVLRSQARFSALWRHDADGWRCHAHHSTSIANP